MAERNQRTAIPVTLSRYRIPAGLVMQSVDALREGSAGRRETVILWQGRIVSETTAEITRMLVPRQIAGPLHFNIPLDERLRLVDEVATQGEFILIQLHTHPREAFHSPVDDRLAITKHTGAISIVVADFCRFWTGNFLETSVNRHEGAGRWCELSHREVSQILEVMG